jgi:hypothetical protein
VTFTGPHCVIYQKTEFFIVNAVRTSNRTYLIVLLRNLSPVVCGMYYCRNLYMCQLLMFLFIQGVPVGKVNILGRHSIGHSKKIVCRNMCPIPNGFRHLARSILNLAHNIFLPSHRNFPMSEACESVWSVSWLLWLLTERKGRKILRAKYKILLAKCRKPFGIGHMFI